VAWRIGTFQANVIRSEFVGASGFRQWADLPARLGTKISSRTAPGTHACKQCDAASSPSKSLAADAGSDCLDA
jgi:hypothetical protein